MEYNKGIQRHSIWNRIECNQAQIERSRAKRPYRLTVCVTIGDSPRPL